MYDLQDLGDHTPPPYDLQIFIRDFLSDFFQDPPGCLPVASHMFEHVDFI